MKNYIIKFTFILLTASVVLLAACNKDDDDHAADTTYPVITWDVPINARYNAGDTIKIKASITDNNLHECLITITNDSTGAVLFTDNPTVHDMSTVAINKFWKAEATKLIKATLNITCEDHKNNVSRVFAKFEIVP